MKNSTILLITLFAVSFAKAQIPAGYYDAATGLTGYTKDTEVCGTLTK